MRKRIISTILSFTALLTLLFAGPLALPAHAAGTLISDTNQVTNMYESPDSVAGISATINVGPRTMACGGTVQNGHVESVYVAKVAGVNGASDNTEFGWSMNRNAFCQTSPRQLKISKTAPATGQVFLWTRTVPDGDYRVTITMPDPTNSLGLYSYFYDYNGVRYYPTAGGNVSTDINASGRIYYNALTDDGWSWGVADLSMEIGSQNDQPGTEHYNIWGQCVHHVCGWAPINSDYAHDVVQWSFGFCPVTQSSEVITFNAGSLGDGITYPWNCPH